MLGTSNNLPITNTTKKNTNSTTPPQQANTNKKNTHKKYLEKNMYTYILVAPRFKKSFKIRSWVPSPQMP